MLKTFHIERFRGFEDLQLINLRRFNIIAGSNNIGKSSLLEALLLFSGATRGIMPAQIESSRDIDVKKITHLYHLFYNQDIRTPLRISGTFDTKATRELTLQTKEFSEGDLRQFNVPVMKIPTNKERFPALSQHYRLTKPDGSLLVEGDHVILADLEGNIQGVTLDTYQETWACNYLPAWIKPQSFFSILQPIIEQKREGYILDAVRAIDPRISKITIIGNDVYVDLGGPTLLPIQLIGEGIQHVISILTALDECRGGGLICIDEIENGLHYTAMKAFWQSIVTFAQAHDIQVVATTHNWEMLQQIAEGLDEPTIEETKFIRLVRRNNGRVITQSLSGPEYVTHVAEGFEIR